MILIDSRSPERIRLGLTIDVVDDSLTCLRFGKDLLVVEFHLGHGKLVAEQGVEKPHENPLVGLRAEHAFEAEVGTPLDEWCLKNI